MPVTIQELERLREERATRQRQVEEYEAELAELEAELARLKGEEPPVAALPEKKWYKRWQTYLVLGIGAVIAGVVIKKKVAKR